MIGAIQNGYTEIYNTWLPMFEAFEHGAFALYIADKLYVCCNPEVYTESTNLDDGQTRRRLHCETGPAFIWLNDIREYYWHGVNVPEKVVMQPGEITFGEINSESNTEVRRAMMQRYGWERLLNEVGAQQVDRDADPTIGELWRWREPDGIDVQILRVKNGTPDPLTGEDKFYSLRVPLDFRRALDAARNSYPVVRHLTDDEYRIWNESRA